MTIKRLLSVCAYTLLYILGAQAQNILSYANQADMEAWVDSIMLTLSPEERLGQLIVPVVANNDNAQQRDIIRSYIEKYHISGLLFSKGTISSQESLTRYAQSLSKKAPLMITSDSEWGLYMRLTDAIRFPRNMALGCINHEDDGTGSNKRNRMMYDYGYEVGQECRAIGISVNFAPVLDINSNPNNPVIGNRSFGDNLVNVASAALSYSSGLEDAGVIATGKHFPGHGDTDKDSHKTLPKLSHDKYRMETFEMRPFEEFIKAGFGGMMVAHLEVPSLEPTKGMPSSASRNIINGYLREKYGFNGLVFTDGLAMEGAKNYPDVCLKALKAGVDILLEPTPLALHWEKLTQALNNGSLAQELVDEKCRRVLMAKYALRCGSIPGKEHIDTQNAEILAKSLYQESLVLLKHDKPFDDNLVIPVTNAKSTTVTQIKQQCKASKKPVTLVFYTSPYSMTYYKDVITSASSVLLAHEDCDYAHEAVENVLSGKNGIDGQLCVDIPNLFKLNQGIVIKGPAVANKVIEDSTDFGGTAIVDNTELQEIDSLVYDGLSKGAYPGCQILVAKDGRIIYHKSFGWYDDSKSRNVTNASVYDLASVTKAAATLPALMMAMDECNISVNDKMSKYLPELVGTDKQHLTIKQALFHETGMRDGYPFYGMTIDSASVDGKLFSGRRDDVYCILQDKNTWFNKNLKWNREWISDKKDNRFSLQIAENMYIDPKFRDEMFAKIISLPIRHVGRYRYSDLNFILLRHIIEVKTQNSLDAYLQKKLFTPLGLTKCGYRPLQNSNIDKTTIVPTENDEAIRKQILVGFVHDETAAWSGGVEGNAGLFSNASDLAKILQLFLDNGRYEGKQIISTETCKLFTTTKSPKTRRGLGFDKPDITNPDKSPCAEETPSTVFGHTGYTGTCFWVDPTNRMIYIFLSNRVNPTRTNNVLSAESYRTRIQSVLYKKIVDKQAH